MTDLTDDPNRVVIITLTARRPDDAPLVLIGGHAVPVERASYDLVDLRERETSHIGDVPYGYLRPDPGPQRKAVVTLVAEPDEVTGEHTRIAARPARPHSEPILGPDGYADTNADVPATLTLERTDRGVCVAIHGEHLSKRVEVDAREVHTLAADLIATLSRPAP